MSNNKIRGKDLNKIGYDNDISRSIAITISLRALKHTPKSEVLTMFSHVKENANLYLDDPVLAPLAETFITKQKIKVFQEFNLLEQSGRLKIYGNSHIEAMAKKQMEVAMSLPVSVAGALMPDAHGGYGLPIGGVLATHNSVIPYGVGVDIGCRMSLSIYDVPESFINHNKFAIKNAIKNFTHFGMDGSLEYPQEHAILDHNDFKATSLLKKLHGKAVKQLGTSGGGNHFVEFGIVELSENNVFDIPQGKYVGLLSHSGSRGLGANIAQHYTKLAMDICKLPKHAQHLAWLSLDKEEGQEYWLSMNLAGEYAKACHDQIHKQLSKALGLKAITKVENHHNFAWKETINETQEVIVHRKGATPAHFGELGIIPGSMTNPGYIVSGKGVSDALNSASHGAGRAMSRSKAKEMFTVSALKKTVGNAGVTLIGGTPEEFPLAYKDIEDVMASQSSLVDIQGKFFPKIVRMNKE